MSGLCKRSPLGINAEGIWSHEILISCIQKISGLYFSSRFMSPLPWADLIPLRFCTIIFMMSTSQLYLENSCCNKVRYEFLFSALNHSIFFLFEIFSTKPDVRLNFRSWHYTPRNGCYIYFLYSHNRIRVIGRGSCILFEECSRFKLYPKLLL